MIHKYRRKPIEAVQFTRENIDEVKRFLGDRFLDALIERMETGKARCIFGKVGRYGGTTDVENAREGDFIISRGDGEFYKCSEKTFLGMYEECETEGICRWIFYRPSKGVEILYCSYCGKESSDFYAYCPKCGKKMDQQRSMNINGDGSTYLYPPEEPDEK